MILIPLSKSKPAYKWQRLPKNEIFHAQKGFSFLRLAWIYHNDRFKALLVFGALDLIFKVILLYVGYFKPLDRFLEICRCRDKRKS